MTMKNLRIKELMETEISTTQKNQIRIVGLSRSGNHAVINWIIHQLQGKYCFLNCTEPKYNPFYTSRPLSEEGKTFKTNIKDFDLEAEQQGNFSEKDYLLFSHEDCFLGNMDTRKNRAQIESWIGKAEEKRNILVLRDPFNMFASRAKSGLLLGHQTHHGARPISTLTLRRIYKQHAREFLREKKNLKDLIPINFNEWNSSVEYRANIAKDLDLEFMDEGYKKVEKTAGGSSFDGVAFSGNPHKMNLQDRWENYKNDDSYWELFDAEIADYSEKIFGKTPALQYYKNNIL